MSNDLLLLNLTDVTIVVCFSPLQAVSFPSFHKDGKKRLSFHSRKTSERFAPLELLDPGNPYGFGQDLKLPCGQCVGCRLDRSKAWAVRCLHESSLYKSNSFLTLTYDQENLPSSGSLVPRHFRNFMKRLRFEYGSGIRFFHCGEYGENLSRPHYHALLFNHDFSDKKYWSKGKFGDKTYISDSLSRLWPYGFHTIGSVNFKSAGYVARYCLKKITGSPKDSHYGDLHPEYVTMSRRPGIASEWYSEFKKDVYPSDFVVVDGKKLRTPRYYDKLFETESPDEFKKIKELRLQKALEHSDDLTPERLDVRHRVQKDKLTRLVREFEIN